jgi:hypothetical protein
VERNVPKASAVINCIPSSENGPSHWKQNLRQKSDSDFTVAGIS